MTQVFYPNGRAPPDTRTALDLVRRAYDEGAGIIRGPFSDCDCESHHQHGPHGAAGCPVCNPPKEVPNG